MATAEENIVMALSRIQRALNQIELNEGEMRNDLCYVCGILERYIGEEETDEDPHARWFARRH
jgi:hypothetical protein